MIGMKTHYVNCECGDFGHIFRFIVDEEDDQVYLEVVLDARAPLHKRLWRAFLYAINVIPSYGGMYDATLVSRADRQRIVEVLQHSLQKV